jgi:hypothetical protein
MDTRLQRLLLAVTVPLSSLLGLARAMEEAGAGLFYDVWAANLWGDLVFIGGTVGAGLAIRHLVARVVAPPAWRFAAAVPAAFLLHWAVYACSWTLTGASGDDGFFAVQAGNFAEAWPFTLEWGWIGLLAMALLGPALALRTVAKAPEAASASIPTSGP